MAFRAGYFCFWVLTLSGYVAVAPTLLATAPTPAAESPVAEEPIAESDKEESKALIKLRHIWRGLRGLKERAEHPNGGTVGTERVDTLKRELALLALETQSLENDGRPVSEAKRRAVVELADELMTELEQGSLKRRLPEPPAAKLRAGSQCHQAGGVGEGTWGLYLNEGPQWLKLKAEHGDYFRISTEGSSVDARLTIHAECGGMALAENDDRSGLDAIVTLAVDKQRPLWLRVDGAGSGYVHIQIEGLGDESSAATLGSISGTVTDAAGGDVLASRQLELYRLVEGGWSYWRSDYSAGDGSFSFSNLASGTYKVRTDFYGSGLHLNQIYPNIDCSSPCSVQLLGEEIELDGNQAVANIDFSLTAPSAVEGWVRDQATGIGIGSAEVRVFDSAGSWVRSDSTDLAGRYRISGLAAGNHRLTAISQSYHGEGWGGASCEPSCGSAAGDVLSIPALETVSGIDFDLEKKGTLSGRVTSSVSNQALSDLRVEIYDAAGDFANSVLTDSSGFYESSGLPAGQYFVATNGYQVINEVWDNIPCVDGNCEPSLGDPIQVVNQQETAGIDFSLDVFGGIEGEVLDALGEAVPTRLSVYDAGGQFLQSVYTDSQGQYSVRLPAGTYYLAATDSSLYYPEVWNNRPCPSFQCDPLTGDPVQVLADTTREANFELFRRGRLEGRVIDELTGQSAGSMFVELYDEVGGFVANTFAGSDGIFEFEGLDAGAYYVAMTSVYEGYIPEVYQDVPCGDSCDPLTGSPVVVTDGEQVTGIDMELAPLGRLSGTVKDASTGDVVDSSGRVFLYDAGGVLVTDDFFFSSGYYNFRDLFPGTYFIVVRAEGYLSQLWQSIDCLDLACDPTTGTPIEVVVGSNLVRDVDMDPGGKIAGRVTDPTTGERIPGVVNVYNSAGELVGSSNFDNFGNWQVSGLLTGQYRVQVDPGERRYVKMAWPDVLCSGGPTCGTTDGTPIQVNRGDTVTGVDFQPNVLSSIAGQVTHAETGEPLASRRVWAFTSTGDSVYWVYTDDQGRYLLEGLGAGTFFVATRNNNTYLDQIYGGGLCESFCDVTSGTAIPLTLFEQRSGVEMALNRSSGFKGRVTSLATGQPLAGVAVDFWYSSHSRFGSTVSDEQGYFEMIVNSSFTELLVSTHNSWGYVDQLWGSVQCPAGSAFEGLCDLSQGATTYSAEEMPLVELPFALHDDNVLFFSGFESGLGEWSSSTP